MTKLEALIEAVKLARDHALPSCTEFPWTTISEQVWAPYAPEKIREQAQGFVTHSPDDKILNDFLGDNKFILRNYIYLFDEAGKCVFLGVPWCDTHKQVYQCTGRQIMLPCQPRILPFPVEECLYLRP